MSQIAFLADRRARIRRATLDLIDLIGLPPTPAEVEAFVGDRSAGAFAKVVDRLLASSWFARSTPPGSLSLQWDGSLCAARRFSP